MQLKHKFHISRLVVYATFCAVVCFYYHNDVLRCIIAKYLVIECGAVYLCFCYIPYILLLYERNQQFSNTSWCVINVWCHISIFHPLWLNINFRVILCNWQSYDALFWKVEFSREYRPQRYAGGVMDKEIGEQSSNEICESRVRSAEFIAFTYVQIIGLAGLFGRGW